MNIAIHSDSHLALSGYGIQTKYLVNHLKELGHGVIVVPKSGFSMTHAMQLDGYNYYPPMGTWGNSGVNALLKTWKPDLFISNLDPWITNYTDVSNWIAWAPIDHNPIPPDELKKLKQCMLPVALTQYSFRQMKDAGLNAMYCPYGIDTSILFPDAEKRKKFRDKLGLRDSDYLIGMVGVNQFDRKGYAEAFQAFKIFKERNATAYLYVHADPLEEIGLDLFEMGKSIGIDVIFPDVFVYREGLTTEDLAYVYNAFDVFLTTTHGEGFGIPLIEAQACGVPVVSTNFMGIPELNPYGLHIACQPYFTPHKSWAAIPIIEDVVRCLEEMHEKSVINTKELVDFARQYDFKEVMKLFDGVIERGLELASLNKHEHKWCAIGTNMGGEIHVPCMIRNCEVGLVVTETKPNELRPGLFHPEYNGVKFDIEDDPKDGVWKVVLAEMPNNQLDNIGLNKDSVCIDIGAQVGMISTYLAKKYGCGVLAYEPYLDNFEHLKRNIKAMGVERLVIPKNAAVYNGKPVKMNRGETNLTGSGRVADDGIECMSVDLNVILDQLDRVDLLKIDVEGGEYEIIYKLTKKNLMKIKHLRGEFHVMPRQDMDTLEEYCKCYIPDVVVVRSELTK